MVEPRLAYGMLGAASDDPRSRRALLRGRPTLAQVEASPRVREALANPQIERGNVKEGAGAERGAPVTIVDPRASPQEARGVNVHEQVEEEAMRELEARGIKPKKAYDVAHAQYALPAEKAAVERAGIPWKPYQQEWRDTLRQTEREKGGQDPRLDPVQAREASSTGAQPKLAYGMLSRAADNPADARLLGGVIARGARYVAPDITSLFAGEPRPPMADLPEYGKVPEVRDPRYLGGALEAANIATQFIGPPGAAAAKGIAAAAVPMARRLIPGLEAKAAREAPNVGATVTGRTASRLASPEEIARAAAGTEGMTQPELRVLYNQLGLTGGGPSPLVEASLRPQPPEEIARVTALKLADREVLNKLTPEQRKTFQRAGDLPKGMMLPSQEAAAPALREFIPLKKEITRAEKAYDAAMAAGRGPAPFFDPSLEALSRPSTVAQFPLPRVTPKTTERLEPAFQSGSGLRRVERAAAAADPRDWFWYNIQEPLGTFRQHLGPQTGAMAAPAWVSSIAGTSMLNPIESNVRGSSYYLGKIMRGEPLPQVISTTDPQTGKTIQTLAGGPPPGYGAKSQTQHAARVRQYLEETADPVANPKPFSYRQNLSGNYMPRTVDTHDIRNMLGMPYAVEALGEEGGLLPSEYAALEQLGGRAAQRAGVPQAMQQGATWIGGREYTGLVSRPEPLVDVLNRRIHVTASVRGETPEEAWINHITGRRALLGIGGAALAGPMLERAGEETSAPFQFQQ